MRIANVCKVCAISGFSLHVLSVCNLCARYAVLGLGTIVLDIANECKVCYLCELYPAIKSRTITFPTLKKIQFVHRIGKKS